MDSKIWVRFLNYTTALTALLIGGATAHAASPSQWCQLVLTQETYESYARYVEHSISKRTEPLRNGKLELTGENNDTVDVLEGINRELALPIFDQGKRQIMSRVAEVVTKWTAASKEDIKSRYEEMKKNKETVRFDADGLPLTPLVQDNRELGLAVLANAKNKMGAADIEQNVAKAVIDKIKAEFVARLKKTTAAIADAQVEALIASFYKVSPRWEALIEGAEPLMREFVAELGALVPLESNGKTVKEAKALAAQPLPAPARARVNAAGVPELVINELGERAYYDAELGTVVLESSKGLIANDQGLIVAIDHGDGTTQSNASSWKYILPKLIAGGVNPVAINLPMAGIGMPIRGLHQTVEYSDLRYRVLRKRADEAGKAALPLIAKGRSMGAQKAFAHGLMREGADNLVDAYFLMSLSNPYTIDKQVDLVNNQVANGTVKGVMQESLENAKVISQELREAIAEIKKKDPASLKFAGEGMLAIQGYGDRDGGKSVVDDLTALRDEVAPMMLIYKFDDPLAKYDIPGIEKMTDDRLEGQHNLLSNYMNMSADDGSRIFPQAKAEDRPMMADQHFEVVGTWYGMGDFIAETKSSSPAMKRRAAKWRAYRKLLTGSEDGKLLDWYRDHNDISKEDFEAAKPGRASRAERLKRVQQFFEDAARDHGAIYDK